MLSLPEYLLDACALLAYIKLEDGWRVVDNLLDRADRGEIRLLMNVVNQIEVFYDRIRNDGIDRANAIFDMVESMPITIIHTVDQAAAHEAARLKADRGRMSLADAILVATAHSTGATLVTSDWAELEPVADQGGIPFLWIRPRPDTSRSGSPRRQA